MGIIIIIVCAALFIYFLRNARQMADGNDEIYEDEIRKRNEKIKQ